MLVAGKGADLGQALVGIFQRLPRFFHLGIGQHSKNSGAEKLFETLLQGKFIRTRFQGKLVKGVGLGRIAQHDIFGKMDFFRYRRAAGCIIRRIGGTKIVRVAAAKDP